VTTTDLVADVADYLVDQCTASSALKALGVLVCDGPQPAGVTTGAEQVLWIGHNPKAPEQEFGKAEQGFAFLAASTRDEAATITCTAKHWTGDTAMRVHRDGCKAIVAVVEELLRGGGANPGPGDSTMDGLVQWSEFTEAAWWQSLAGGGAEAYCAFDISYFARLT
jgi:hypothetical protein